MAGTTHRQLTTRSCTTASLELPLSWQVMFLVIGSNPIRYRTAMLPAMLEKASFAVAIPILYALGRVPAAWVAYASMDAAWFVLFGFAYLRTPLDGSPA